MHAKIYGRAIIIEGIHTHTYANTIVSELRDILIRKERRFKVFFEGSPGPLGEGITVKIFLDKNLSNLEVNVLQKYFELRKIRATLFLRDNDS